MKKKILSIVICLCLAVTMLQGFELSFVASAATLTCAKITANGITCNGSTTVSSTAHAFGCPLHPMNINSCCGYLQRVPNADAHFKYCKSSTTYTSAKELVFEEKFFYSNVANKTLYSTSQLMDVRIAEIGNYASTFGLTATEVDQIKTYAAANNVQWVYYRKMPNGTQNKHWSTTQGVLIKPTAVLILDLNGNVLQGDGTGPVITNYGFLIIKDSNTDNQHEGIMQGRGYYFYDDDTGYSWKETRNFPNAIWGRGSTDEYGIIHDGQAGTNHAAALAANQKTYVYGGFICGGRTVRNISIPKTYEDYYSASGKGYGDAARYYYTYFAQARQNYTSTNTYGFGGGGIHNEGSVIMDGGGIIGCESTQGPGAAVHNKGATASFTMNGGRIMYNFGASIVSARNGAKITINAGTIFRNVGVGNGAIDARTADGGTKCTVVVGQANDPDYESAVTKAVNGTDSTTSHMSNLVNKINGVGRAILFEKGNGYGVPVIDSNMAVSGLISDGNGGGIYAHDANLTINTAIITNNWSHYRGGGVDIFSQGNVTLSGKILVQNNYCELKGGGVSLRNPNNDSTKCTLNVTSDTVKIIGNKAGYGGGIHVSYGKVNISGGEISGNEATGYSVQPKNYKKSAGASASSYVSQQIISFLGKTDHSLTYNGKATTLTANVSTDTMYSASGAGIYVEGADGKTEFNLSGGKIFGNSAPFRGGGVYVVNGYFNMTGGEIYNNTVTQDDDEGSGGGVYVLGQENKTLVTFKMSGGKIYNNTSVNQHAGGVMVTGSADISGTAEITGNSCHNNGGGIYASTGNFTLSGNAKISNNTSVELGGGIFLYNIATNSTPAKFTMSGGEVSGNKVTTNNGGGIYILNSKFIMTGGTIKKNLANCSDYNKNNSTWNNGADIGKTYGRGGGICVVDGTVEISGNSIIDENEAAFAGGGLYVLSNSGENPQITIGTNNVSSSQPLITNNKVTADLKKFVKQATLDAGTLIHGDYQHGGGAIAVKGSKATIKIYNTEISGNSTPDPNIVKECDRISGGALYIDSDDTSDDGNVIIDIVGGSIHDNSSPNDQGGAIYARERCAISISGGNHYNNYAYDNGGFIYISSGKVDISDGAKIYDNTADKDYGGAISINNGTVHLYDGELYGNKVNEDGGGAVIIHNAGNFYMYDGAVYGNSTGSKIAEANGGAVCLKGTGNVYVYGGKVGLKPDGTAAGNVATGNGGAFYVNSGNIYIGKVNCDGLKENSNHNTINSTLSTCGHPIVANNQAANGGGLYSKSGTTTFYCGEMKSNIASNKGGGMYVEGGTVTIKNATITNNSASQDFYGDSLYMTGGTVKYDKENTFTSNGGASTGVVVAGGTLSKTDVTKVVSVYFKDRESDMEVKGFEVPLGEKIILPQGTDVFPNYTNHTFIGWQYPNVDGYVRESDDYKLSGTEIVVEDNAGSSGEPKMVIYGVWANAVNTVSYYTMFDEKTKINNFSTQYSYPSSASNVLTMPTPTLAQGYTFTGWAMQQGSDCNTECNANWGISAKPSDNFASANLYKAGQTIPTNGKFGNLHFVATWSSKIEYFVKTDDDVGDTSGGTVQVQNASTTYEDFTITNKVSAINGATATVTPNYTFKGWFTDESCTGEPVSKDLTYVPQLNANGYYDNLKYYAKFELEYKNLTIKTNGADDDQTFVFTVKGTSGYASNVEMQVYVIGGTSYTTIEHIPAGNYVVYENNIESKTPQGIAYHQGNTWTWRYTDTEVQNAVVNGTQDLGETAVDCVTFNYFTADDGDDPGSKNIKNWLNGLSYKFNSLIKGN